MRGSKNQLRVLPFFQAMADSFSRGLVFDQSDFRVFLVGFLCISSRVSGYFLKLRRFLPSAVYAYAGFPFGL